MSRSNAPAWVQTYVERSGERVAGRDTSHLHQTAGWYDIPQVEDWRSYVTDVVREHVKPGAKVFEAGCGVLAFLAEVRALEPSVSLYGVDGSATSIEVIRKEVAPAFGIDAGAFSVGLLPDALVAQPSDFFDLTLCHSVLQYVPREAGFRTAEELLRMTRPGGTAIIADVCDELFRAEEEPRLAAYWPSYGQDLPNYTYFAAADWERFAAVAEVKIRRTNVLSYRRRRSRYLVYLQKR